MRIQHNIMAMSAYRNYTNNVSAMKKNLEKLSSGYKINRAGDDAAGLAISEKMRAQITGLETAQKNAKDGISLVQTAEGALTEVHDMLNRMVELATQSANGTYDNTTDRAQMQKEVNQLLEEIDRIADSSNFNGINLLDGTLGLNTDAFDVGNTVAAVEASDATTSPLKISNYHGGSAVAAQAPSFQIDLDKLEFTAEAAIATDATVATINFGGRDYKLLATAAIATGVKVNATKIGNMLVTAFNTGSLDTTANKVGAFGGAGFSASNTNGVVTFTYQGKLTGGDVASTDVDTAAASMTASMASNINKVLGGAVTVTAASKATVNGKKEHICDITAPKNAVAAQTADRPGADIDLSSVVKNGVQIEIDGNKYVFKTGSATVATNGATLIDVSNVAASQQAARAAMMIAGKPGANAGNANGSAVTTTDFKVSYGGGATVHIDAKDAVRGNYKSEAAIQAKVTVTTPAQEAQGAGVELTVTDGEIKDGNTLTVDGKKYVFNTKGTGTGKASEVSYIKVSDGMAGLKTALETDGYDVTAAGNKLTIRAAVATGADPLDTKAPVILGKGLTLQIGDTSDDFNQLNVAVQDMHAENLGIGNLDISTEEAAQAAIKSIKDAINTVSDVRGTLGATQNRLDHTINNLSVMTENIQDAESTIRDVDVAEEMMAYTKNNILIQSAQAMLAQANQVPQGVLQLLQ